MITFDRFWPSNANLLHVGIVTDGYTYCSSICALHWVFQQVVMIKTYFTFITTLSIATESICIITIYIHWKNVKYGPWSAINYGRVACRQEGRKSDMLASGIYWPRASGNYTGHRWMIHHLAGYNSPSTVSQMLSWMMKGIKRMQFIYGYIRNIVSENLPLYILSIAIIYT